MERAPKKIIDKQIGKETVRFNDVNDVFEFIYRNAMGSPVIFESAPTNAQMKANSWGKVSGVNTAIYIKFSDGGAIKITGTELS